VMYTADWNSIKLSAAYTYTWMESGADSGTFQAGLCDFPGSTVDGCFGDQDSLHNDHLNQIGGSILHKPSGLGIFGQYTHEETGGHSSNFLGFDSEFIGADPVFFNISTPTADTWYLKPFWRKTWSPIGATTLFGEYGQYNDQFNAFGGGLCGTFDGSSGTHIDTFCNTFSSTSSGGLITSSTRPIDVFVTGSEVQRWGLGVVQEIDSAAMHVYARWQHQQIDLDLTGITETDHIDGSTTFNKQHVGQGFEDWDLFQVGGIIFF